MIHVEGLTKKYKDFLAVDNISFEVQPGEIFAFLGPNGAGKSTTIKMLTTLLRPTAGHAELGGFDVQAEPNQVRRSIGIVFQDPSLDDEMTAVENMMLHAALYGVDRSTRGSQADELLKFVDLWDKRNDFVKTFSGGMKRRLEIARGLLHHPKVLFLDEPTLGLDPQTRNHMWDYVRNLNKQEGMTIFFTTHYMEEAQEVAQRVAIIDHGKIIAMGSPRELMDQTQTDSLEKSFLALTGNQIRAEEAGSTDRMRTIMRTLGRKR